MLGKRGPCNQRSLDSNENQPFGFQQITNFLTVAY